jgi:glutamate-ammonia-ligase adenylyltransferase
MTLFATLSSHTAPLPAPLQDLAADFCARLSETIEPRHLACFEHPAFAASLLKVCACSQFVSENWLRHPELVPDLVQSGALFSTLRREDYAAELQNAVVDSEAGLAKLLRQFRRREMLRIAWRDLAGWADLDETLSDLTLLAESCIGTALNFLYHQACQRWGTPTLANGAPFNLVVLGMGKLGAWELNFSSDIDLIFAYAEEGLLTEKKEISYGEFFTRICRSLLKALDEITVDGFVFRTDIRLRPFGDSGPILMTFDGMENYYLNQAREWERYAMIKARQVAGDFHTGRQLAAIIKPFVYRRYLDYGAFEELRGLKFQITQELKRKDRLENIKLGPGGIREVEFIGQAFQLIRGGHEPVLQQREIQIILMALPNLKLMALEDASALKFAYRFLRRVENHIQQYQDKQTHDLPEDALQQLILAWSLDFPDWDSFKQELNQVRTRVHRIFVDVFSFEEQDGQRLSGQMFWAGRPGDEQVLEVLNEYGYADPVYILKLIVDFKESHAVRHMSNKGVNTLQRLLPQLIAGLRNLENRDIALKRILDLFEAVAGRNVYLSLLAENPEALKQLSTLSAASPWICEYLAQYPMLFDELLSDRSLYAPLQKSDLSRELQQDLAKIDVADDEQLMIALRKFKHVNVLRVAVADIMGLLPVMTVSDYLTWIAEAALEEVLNCAWQTLGKKYGCPPGTDQTATRFAIFAFGKLGGRELGYGSDLDIVFFHNYPDGNLLTTGAKPVNCGLFYLRLAHKIIHILDTKMLSGILYELDLRLRPNGDSGLIAPHIDSYEDYLRQHAWTWEHQALVRARHITGDRELKAIFEDIRRRILTISRDVRALKTQVLDMREKMRGKLSGKQNGIFDLKQHAGGVTDIEFLVQFLVLAHAAKNPALIADTGNIRLLESLAQQHFIDAADANILTLAYCAYRYHGHQQILQGNRPVALSNEFIEQRTQIQRIWHEILE